MTMDRYIGRLSVDTRSQWFKVGMMPAFTTLHDYRALFIRTKMTSITHAYRSDQRAIQDPKPHKPAHVNRSWTG
jgi:hypothetical protein